MTAVEQAVAECTRELKHELAGVDPGMEIELEKIPRETAVLSQEDSAAYVSLINLLPSGVLEMERDDEGKAEEPSALRLTMNRLPETSCNIGMVYMEGSRICIHCNCRSSYGSKKRWLQEKCRLLAACHGRTAYSVLTDYPEWEFNPDSRLARLICREYRAQTGEPLLVERSHGEMCIRDRCTRACPWTCSPPGCNPPASSRYGGAHCRRCGRFCRQIPCAP